MSIDLLFQTSVETISSATLDELSVIDDLDIAPSSTDVDTSEYLETLYE